MSPNTLRQMQQPFQSDMSIIHVVVALRLSFRESSIGALRVGHRGVLSSLKTLRLGFTGFYRETDCFRGWGFHSGRCKCEKHSDLVIVKCEERA